MTQRGRKTPTNVTPIDDYRPPEAPASLDKLEAMFWDEIVAGNSKDHFRDSDMPLLEQYCRVAKTLIPESLAESDIAGYDKLVRLTMSLATKLRLCPSTRIRAEKAKLRSPSRPSWER
jgi:hypothetical protein